MLYLGALLTLLIAGPGAASIDHILARKVTSRHQRDGGMSLGPCLQFIARNRKNSGDGLRSGLVILRGRFLRVRT